MSAEDVLFHGKQIPIARGGYIVVNPWGIKTGRRIMVRIKTVLTMFRAATAGDLDLGAILDGSYDEAVYIVAESIGIEVSELEDPSKFLLEDLLGLLKAIIEVNFLERPQFMEKLIGLFRMLDMEPTTEEAETETTPETPPSDLPPSSSS